MEKNKQNCPICGQILEDENNGICCCFACQQIFESEGVRFLIPEKWYRKICFNKHPHKCVCCNEYIILDVHHYNKKRTDNYPSNLVPLCPTHHRYMHTRKQRNNPVVILMRKKVYEYVEEFISKSASEMMIETPI